MKIERELTCNVCTRIDIDLFLLKDKITYMASIYYKINVWKSGNSVLHVRFYRYHMQIYVFNQNKISVCLKYYDMQNPQSKQKH